MEHFASKASEGFDPDTDLEYIGVANQTTMLAKESLAIGWKVHEAFVERFGEEHASTFARSVPFARHPGTPRRGSRYDGGFP